MYWRYLPNLGQHWGMLFPNKRMDVVSLWHVMTPLPASPLSNMVTAAHHIGFLRKPALRSEYYPLPSMCCCPSLRNDTYWFWEIEICWCSSLPTITNCWWQMEICWYLSLPSIVNCWWKMDTCWCAPLPNIITSIAYCHQFDLIWNCLFILDDKLHINSQINCILVDTSWKYHSDDRSILILANCQGHHRAFKAAMG